MTIRVQPWTRWLLSTALFFFLCLAATSLHAQPQFDGDDRGVAVDIAKWIIATVKPVGDRLPTRQVLFEAPDFTLPTLSGETVRLADLKGKVILLNFWATWCVPCRTEMPTIEALYQRYKDRGLEVLVVSLDKGSTDAVEAFVKEVGMTVRVVLDPDWSTARAYRIRGLPTTFLIDRRGNVVVREIGAKDWADGASQLEVEGLLQESNAAP